VEVRGGRLSEQKANGGKASKEMVMAESSGVGQGLEEREGKSRPLQKAAATKASARKEPV